TIRKTPPMNRNTAISKVSVSALATGLPTTMKPTTALRAPMARSMKKPLHCFCQNACTTDRTPPISNSQPKKTTVARVTKTDAPRAIIPRTIWMIPSATNQPHLRLRTSAPNTDILSSTPVTMTRSFLENGSFESCLRPFVGVAVHFENDHVRLKPALYREPVTDLTEMLVLSRLPFAAGLVARPSILP